ncbi:MAG TPA: glycine zipper 2TM domain-containing protein [Solimonas sp.]|nr:glycine zipper 2TM domain-containing protein [Solimonas sp.]
MVSASNFGSWSRLGAALLLAASVGACDRSRDAEQSAADQAAFETSAADKAAADKADKTPAKPAYHHDVVVKERERVVYTEPPKPVVCADCGTIASIEPVKAKGDASGAGAIMGAIAGGVIGHQFGSGKGNDAATAAGAIGGGLAGHEIEKNMKGTTYYKVTVMMENGTSRTVNLNTTQGISVGSRVRVIGNDLQLRA